MSVFRDILYCLDAHLKTLVPLPPVAWENKNYKPVKDTLYLRPTILPAETVQATLGDNGTDSNSGIYQIDVFTPSGKGIKAAIEMADKIANLFKRGTYITYNGRTVRVKSVGRERSSNDDNGWYIVPVVITYISFTEARI